MSTVISERIDEAEARIDLDIRAEAERLVPAVVPPTPNGNGHGHAARPQAARPDPRARILGGLLRMADSYREGGSIRQALEMYFELAREHGETPQGEAAEERVLEIARMYELNGELRAARALYEQLL